MPFILVSAVCFFTPRCISPKAKAIQKYFVFCVCVCAFDFKIKSCIRFAKLNRMAERAAKLCRQPSKRATKKTFHHRLQMSSVHANTVPTSQEKQGTFGI